VGDPDKDKPNRFKADGLFWLDLTFDDPVPTEGVPWAELVGPTDHAPLNAQGLSTAGKAPQPDSPTDPRKTRISGQIPANAPPGTYKVVALQMQWGGSASPTWHNVSIDFTHLGEDLTIIVDPKDGAPPQPTVPKLTDLD
jgi:hypothetical protein